MSEAPFGHVHALDTGSRLRPATAHETVAFAREKGTNWTHFWRADNGSFETVVATSEEISAAESVLQNRTLPAAETEAPEAPANRPVKR